MNLPQTVENIKAESFLASFLESCSDINIDPQGVFSRNYNEDIIGIDIDSEAKEKMTIQLSRDGLFHILPEGIFFKENELREIGRKKNTEKFKLEEERINKEKQKIRLFFQPFDTAYFRLRFELEKKLNEIATNRIRIFFDELLDVFPVNLENPYIKKVIPLIPVSSEIRGNARILKDILKAVFFPAKIEMQNRIKQKTTGNSGRIMKITVHIEKLSAEEFRNLKKEADVFACFFYEWFLPVDLEYQFKVKDTKEQFILGSPMTLDYNTYLK